MSDLENYAAEMRQEFMDRTGDELQRLQSIIESLETAQDAKDRLADMRRVAHSLKGQGSLFDFPVVTVIAHRWEDYMIGMTEASPAQVLDIQAFIDRVQDVMDGKISGTADASQIVRELPAKHTAFEVGDITKTDVEVMLIAPSGTQNHFVERELAACGYRVTRVTSPFVAIELIFRTSPDLVIASAVLPDMSGIELSQAMKSMDRTTNVPFALLTSYNRGHYSLKGLPESVPIIQKGAQFGEDLAEALEALNIT